MVMEAVAMKARQEEAEAEKEAEKKAARKDLSNLEAFR